VTEIVDTAMVALARFVRDPFIATTSLDRVSDALAKPAVNARIQVRF
jgi:hypothetical protein